MSFAVAGIATLFGVPFHTALLLGAAVAPPDATAVAALGRLLPERTSGEAWPGGPPTTAPCARAVRDRLVALARENVTGWSITAMVLRVPRRCRRGHRGRRARLCGCAAPGTALTINITLLLVPFAAFLVAGVDRRVGRARGRVSQGS
ncbi:MAG: hypothetical protein R2692_00500 [Microbacterium sp.]